MNFDLENAVLFLAGLESHTKLGLPVSELVAFTQTTTVKQERSKHLTVNFRGQARSLEYRVFMDDVDAPDLYFFTPSKELAKLIQSEMRAFAKKHGL